jgi:hypothetical protein
MQCSLHVGSVKVQRQGLFVGEGAWESKNIPKDRILVKGKKQYSSSLYSEHTISKIRYMLNAGLIINAALKMSSHTSQFPEELGRGKGPLGGYVRYWVM